MRRVTVEDIRVRLAQAAAVRRFGVADEPGDGLSRTQRELVARYAPGRTFADMGCMWRLHGAVAFLADDSAATSVTAFDAMEPTEQFLARQEQTCVRYVRGDLQRAVSSEPVDDPHVTTTGVDAVGPHDVVWCSGVLYHAPNPVLLLQNLWSITGRYLIVGTKSLPGRSPRATFLPGLTDRQRLALAPLWAGGITAGFDSAPYRDFANWWWGLTPSAIRGIVGTLRGAAVVGEVRRAWHPVHDDYFVVVERQATFT